jgi:hypothetical protein
MLVIRKMYLQTHQAANAFKISGMFRGHPFCSRQEVLQDSRTASKLTKLKQTSKFRMQWPLDFPPRLREIGDPNPYAVAMVTLLGSEAPSAPKNSVASSPSTSPSSK